MPYKTPEAKRARHREYMRTVWYPKNKKKHISLVAAADKKRSAKILGVIREKRGSLSCSKCGENHASTLDFHHLNPKIKEFSISRAIKGGHSLKRILSEVEKCIVLCSNCHRKHHRAERNAGL